MRLNRAQRRHLSRKAPHLLLDNYAHVCQDGAHVLFQPEHGYLLSLDDKGANFGRGDEARELTQRFHQECAQHFAAQVKAAHDLELAVRHQDEAEAEGWR